MYINPLVTSFLKGFLESEYIRLEDSWLELRAKNFSITNIEAVYINRYEDLRSVTESLRDHAECIQNQYARLQDDFDFLNTNLSIVCGNTKGYQEVRDALPESLVSNCSGTYKDIPRTKPDGWNRNYQIYRHYLEKCDPIIDYYIANKLIY